jgi:excisionase family DNA binding protein
MNTHTRPPNRKTSGPAKAGAPISNRSVPRSGRKLTVAEVTKDLGISTRTFYRWKKAGTAPETFPLPGGGLRIYESIYTAWLESRSARGVQREGFTAFASTR